MAVALVITTLVILPNFIWALHHQELALSLVYKFGIHESMPWPTAVWTGVTNWLIAVLAHLAPLVFVLSVIFWKPDFLEGRARFHSDEEHLLARTFIILFGLVLLCVALLKVTQFKDRWLQPIFICTPILLIALLQDCLNRARLRFAFTLGLVITIGTSVLASGRLLFTEVRARRDVLNAPFRKLAADLKPSAENVEFIVAGDYWLAGNLQLWFPDKHIFSPDLAPPDPAAGKRCLVVWDASRSPELPGSLRDFTSVFVPDSFDPTPHYFEEPWKYHQSKTMKLGACVLRSESIGMNMNVTIKSPSGRWSLDE
jgi:hypothetical protein